jgi:hypothetical protein
LLSARPSSHNNSLVPSILVRCCSCHICLSTYLLPALDHHTLPVCRSQLLNVSKNASGSHCASRRREYTSMMCCVMTRNAHSAVVVARPSKSSLAHSLTQYTRTPSFLNNTYLFLSGSTPFHPSVSMSVVLEPSSLHTYYSLCSMHSRALIHSFNTGHCLFWPIICFERRPSVYCYRLVAGTR